LIGFGFGFGVWECFQKFYEKDPTTFTAWQYLHQSDVIGNLSPELRDILHEAGRKVVALQHKIVGYGIERIIHLNINNENYEVIVRPRESLLDAAGVRIKDMPITPEKVLRALERMAVEGKDDQLVVA
jgi:hypothetical protein